MDSMSYPFFSTQHQPEFPCPSLLTPHTPGCHLAFLKASALPMKLSDSLWVLGQQLALALTPSHLPALNLELIQWV